VVPPLKTVLATARAHRDPHTGGARPRPVRLPADHTQPRPAEPADRQAGTGTLDT
jgi:hypothetical protein